MKTAFPILIQRVDIFSETSVLYIAASVNPKVVGDITHNHKNTLHCTSCLLYEKMLQQDTGPCLNTSVHILLFYTTVCLKFAFST